MIDARPIRPQPWSIKKPEELAELHDFLADRKRQLPVFLLTQPDERRSGIELSLPRAAGEGREGGLEFFAPALHARRAEPGQAAAGAWHRRPPSEGLNQRWTDRVGKEWSAFKGAVRTYRPGLDFEHDAPAHHPLAPADRILAFRRGGKVAEAAFADFLVEQMQLFAATKRVDWQPCVFYAEAVQREAAVARARDKGNDEWRQLYEQEVEVLRKSVEEANDIVATYAGDIKSLQGQLEEASAENRSLRIYLDSLRGQWEAQHLEAGKSADSAVPVPDTYEGFAEWVERHLAGRLQLHPRAERGLEHARFQDVALVYRALLALAREYRDMRLRAPDDVEPKLAWDAKLAELGLSIRRLHHRDRRRPGGGHLLRGLSARLIPGGRRFLDSHLRKGKAKDDELCLAIYFFWDDEKREVVVGWLPSHLDNRMT